MAFYQEFNDIVSFISSSLSLLLFVETKGSLQKTVIQFSPVYIMKPFYHKLILIAFCHHWLRA
jgi:hypothetical protein